MHPPGSDIGFQFTAMATACTIRVAGLSEAEARPMVQRAIDEVRRIETKYSRYRDDSIVSRINAAAGSGTPLEVDDETAWLLDFAAQLFDLSDGLFDITSGCLRRVWDFKAGRLPDPGRLAEMLQRIGWQRVSWQDRRIALPDRGMEIDFGGFGKEYAADRAATVLQEAGLASGIVNLGGDIRVLGPPPGGAPWSLGIVHPRRADAVVASLHVDAGALATSGDYERYFEAGGRRYCHILDPRTGWPVDCWQSVSVVAPVCLAAGALTTIAMLKEAAAPDFLRAQGVGFLLVDQDGRMSRESL